jgi:hypothetical protein
MRRAEREFLKFAFHEFSQSAVPSRNSSSDAEDLLPEDTHYQDDGCRLAPSCLNCPLPECAEDSVHGPSKIAKQQRNADIVRLFLDEKKTYPQLVSQFGLSLRSIKYIIARRPLKPKS